MTDPWWFGGNRGGANWGGGLGIWNWVKGAGCGSLTGVDGADGNMHLTGTGD